MKKKALTNTTVPVAFNQELPPISMSCDSTMRMLMVYFPTQTKRLLSQAVNKAKRDRRLEMGGGYQAEFLAEPAVAGQPC